MNCSGSLGLRLGPREPAAPRGSAPVCLSLYHKQRHPHACCRASLSLANAPRFAPLLCFHSCPLPRLYLYDHNAPASRCNVPASAELGSGEVRSAVAVCPPAAKPTKLVHAAARAACLTCGAMWCYYLAAATPPPLPAACSGSGGVSTVGVTGVLPAQRSSGRHASGLWWPPPHPRRLAPIVGDRQVPQSRQQIANS